MKNLILLVSCSVLLCVIGTQSYTSEVTCPGEHEYFDCSVACDNVCSELHIQNKTNCPIVNIQCNKKCYCKDEYARDDKGICVPIAKCPENKKCPPNEEYKTCKRTCPPETCMSLVARFKCPGSPLCEPGCGCKDGFLRIKNGEPCVPICQCPELTNSSDYNPCPPNEEYTTCKRTCPPETCLSLVVRFRCMELATCEPGCRCKNGFLRKRNGEPCIPTCQCPESASSPDYNRCPPNEEYTTCKRTCPPDDCFSVQAQYYCGNAPACEPGCACKDGFLRKKLGKSCVPLCQCPQLSNSPECSLNVTKLN